MYIFFTLAHTVKCLNIGSLIYRSNSYSVLHANHDVRDWYKDHILPAWEWAKNELKRINQCEGVIIQKDIDGCYTMLKTYLAEFIYVACQQGLTIKQIQCSIEDTGFSYLYQDSSVWVDLRSQSVWNSFHQFPNIMWLKYRTYGLFVHFARLFRNNQFVQSKRYPEEISTSIY